MSFIIKVNAVHFLTHKMSRKQDKTRNSSTRKHVFICIPGGIITELVCLGSIKKSSCSYFTKKHLYDVK